MRSGPLHKDLAGALRFRAASFRDEGVPTPQRPAPRRCERSAAFAAPPASGGHRTPQDGQGLFLVDRRAARRDSFRFANLLAACRRETSATLATDDGKAPRGPHLRTACPRASTEDYRRCRPWPKRRWFALVCRCREMRIRRRRRIARQPRAPDAEPTSGRTLHRCCEQFLRQWRGVRQSLLFAPALVRWLRRKSFLA